MRRFIYLKSVDARRRFRAMDAPILPDVRRQEAKAESTFDITNFTSAWLAFLYDFDDDNAPPRRSLVTHLPHAH